ncbi:MAG: EamA family transporter [Pseudomonadales bacterium]|jgi:drug/metabolite transporter (DMT)-like permease|nr:EamA family transporter [Pseudomonadales bacterium]
MSSSVEYRKGLLLTLGGVLVFTPDSLLIRLTDVDPFTLAVGRGVPAGLIMLLGYALVTRQGLLSSVRAIGRWGVLVCLLQGTCSITFLAAFSYTSVANVLVIFACTPLIAALLSWLIFREKVSASTYWAIVGAASGLAIVASGSFGGIRWFGDSLALLNAVLLATVFTILRGHREINMIPASGIGLLIGALVSIPFAGFPPLDALQVTWLALAGVIILPLALTLLTLGPRYLPAPEVGMIMLLEAVLGPLWVWLVIQESPGIPTLIGGTVVLVVLFVHSLWRLRTSGLDSG